MENNKMTLKIDLGRTGLDAGDAFRAVENLMADLKRKMYSEDDKSLLKDGIVSDYTGGNDEEVGRFYFSEV